MSAYIVDKSHIDALVALAVRGPVHLETVKMGRPYIPGTVWHGVYWQRGENPIDAVRVNDLTADELGSALWSENVRSIHGRYHDTLGGGTYPGPLDFTPEHAMTYSWPFGARRLTAIAGLKALDCYEYQSCEHPGWPDSAAFRFCDALRRALIGSLPGYADAEWSVSA